MEIRCFMIFQHKITDQKGKGSPYKLRKKLRNKEAIDINERGMSLEVDLEYPKEIHEQHGDFPMAPEIYNVTYNELSPLNQFLY